MRRLIVPAPLPAFALAAVTSHTTIDSSASAAGFTQQLSSFGIDLFATAGTPAAALQHAACVMDQYLDQDRDGIADDANVVAELTARQAAMVMGATEDDLEDTTDNSGSFGDRALQDVYASETAYDGATYFDASLEEVLHLITQHGYANAYPSSFGEYSGTTLADAIDAVIGDCEMSWECGGGEDEDQNNDDDKYGSGSGDDQNRGAGEQFCEESGFSQEECGSYDSSACACQWDDGQCWYAGGSCSGRRLDDCEDYSTDAWVPGSCSGGFHYSDTTCDYGCLITEGLYWGVTALLGAQENRCDDINQEWEPCTPALMRSDAPALASLIDTMGITVLPDGNCGLDDLDGDGVEDAAPDDQCCTYCYGCDFATRSCGGTLEEVEAAGCCPDNFLLRYSVQFSGEDQSGFDCVSFVAEADCGGFWMDAQCMRGDAAVTDDATTTDDVATDDNYVPAATTNWGSSVGWCYSSLDREIGSATGDECWALCEATYGSSLVAIDWNGDSECYCQSACECMMDAGDGDGYLMTVDSISSLPGECPASYYNDDDGTSSCGDRRGCNAPSAYSSLTVNGDNEPLYVQSTGFSATLRAGVETGVDLTRNMIGTASDTRIYLLEPYGDDDVYSALVDDYCEFVGWENWSQCGDSERSAAQSGGGQYYLSGAESCVCGEYTYVGAPMFMMPGAYSDARMIAERAIHEYTHVVQKASGGPMPAWLMEGGAVFNECWLAPYIPWSYYSSFSECFEYGGGGGGVLNNVRQLYLDDPSVPWFTLWANDRCCGSDCPATHGEGVGMQDRYIYYDLGAYAVAMAIARADAKLGRTINDFWTSAERGFWRRTDIPYGPIDHVNGWSSDVPEGFGWRKALSEFLGDETTADFYAQVEATIVRDGVVATTDQLMAAISGTLSDDAVAAAAQVVTDFTSCEFNTAPRTACNEGLGCGVAAAEPGAPSPAPTSAPVVTGSVTFSGISAADAEESKAVLQDAIARVAGVDTDDVTILSVSSARRRRLQAGLVASARRRRLQTGVVVEYKISSPDLAASQDVAENLADAAADPTLVDTAVSEAAGAAGAEAVFADVATESLAHDVVSTAAPTPATSNKKKSGGSGALIIIIVVVIAGVICFCSALGIGAICGFMFVKKKRMPGITQAEASEAPPAPEAAYEMAPRKF